MSTKTLIKPYELKDLIKVYLKTLFVKSSGPAIDFPKTIKEYTFVETFQKIGPKKSYQLGIYKDKKGNKFFAKMANSKVHNYHYFSLKNEIQVYKILNNYSQTIKKPIRIPWLYTDYEDNERLVALFEFITAKPVVDASELIKVKYFLEAENYLNLLGSKIAKSQKSLIAKRDPEMYFLLFPYVLTKSILNYPQKILTFIKSAFVFYSNYSYFARNYEESLLHRDLHFRNILKKGKTLYIIDLQQSVYGERMHDYVTILRYFWDNKLFTEIFLKQIIKVFGKRKNFPKVFQLLMINSAVHGLTDKSFPKRTIHTWFDFLDFSLNYK